MPDGQWYLHIFAPEQPDLNWDNPEVHAEFERILRFWLDRGVDGFRVDVAHSMAKPAGLPDMDLTNYTGPHTQLDPDLRFDQDGVHECLRLFRRVLDSYPHRMAVGEAWVPDDQRLALYVRPDELHLTFNFRLIEAPWSARPSPRRSTVRSRRWPMSARRAPGCCPTTTWCATPPATAAARWVRPGAGRPR